MKQTSPSSFCFCFHTELLRWHTSTSSEHGLYSVSARSMRISSPHVGLSTLYNLTLGNASVSVRSLCHSKAVRETSGMGLHFLMSWQSLLLPIGVILSCAWNLSNSCSSDQTFTVFLRVLFWRWLLICNWGYSHIHKCKPSLTHLNPGQEKVSKAMWNPLFN